MLRVDELKPGKLVAVRIVSHGLLNLAIKFDFLVFLIFFFLIFFSMKRKHVNHHGIERRYL